MPAVRRIYVEKKPTFDIEAQHMLDDLRDNLGMKSITGLRLFNRYDVTGLEGENLKRARNTIFSETNVDNVYGEELPEGCGDRIFATEYLPGQYDQRADSAEQCVQLLTQSGGVRVVSAKVIALTGDITDGELEAVKRYIINPVESREASMEKPETLEMDAAVPEDVKNVDGFTSYSDAQIEEYHAQNGFAMTVSDLCFCRDYFKNEEHRDPTVTELKVIDTYWSDHCRHTTFLTELDHIEVEEGGLSAAINDALNEYMKVRAQLYEGKKKDVCLMDMATIGGKYLRKQGKLDDLDISEEINACSIEVPVEIDGRKEQWLVQFKNETHNHPTEIEPFGGAATCLGGAIRDPLSGRAYVYQAMRVTGSGDPTVPVEDTLEGKLPQKKITTGAAQGYSSYGNQIGLATGQVTELYDEGYLAKRLEIGAVIGASPKENVIRERPAAGDVIVLLGGRTGRDGCGGATGSSKAHTLESIETCGAEVQKGNPPTERKIQRLFRKKEVSTLIKRCNDFGAGGVCVAIGELADGLTVNLDSVPKKYEGLDGTELAISESQERMAVVLDPSNVQRFIDEALKENLEATAVAVVTESPRLKMTWRGKTIVDLSRAFLNTNGVTQHADAKITSVGAGSDYRTAVPESLKGLDTVHALAENMARLEVCSQKGLVERFDSSIGASTVLMPFAGKYQLTPEDAMCAKIPLEKGETDDATAMSYGFIPKLSKWSPFHGAVYAVMESLAKLASIGADPLKARLTMQEYFERLYDRPERWGKPAAALLGGLLAQLKLGIPSIGGKDSMSGSFNDLDVPPTLVCFAVAMTKASKTSSSLFKSAGDRAVLLKLPVDDETRLPDWSRASEYLEKVYKLVEDGDIKAASAVREGGAAAAVCRMAFGDKYGFNFEQVSSEELFAPLAGCIVAEVEDEKVLDGLEYTLLGTISEKPVFTAGGGEIETDSLIEAWKAPLEKVFPSKGKVMDRRQRDIPLYTARHEVKTAGDKFAKPRIFIPVFPGTNCEVDSARAFEKAGGVPEILVVKNLTPSDIEDTIDKMAAMIRNSQIIMFPGGFSGGDEPDGSGKFIATTFRNPKIMEAVTDLLENRDGLMLGICNGFQAMIKLGLVPYGKIVDTAEDDPTLTFNTLGRHISTMAYTRITSVKSPWFSKVNVGDVFAVPISHGEGRFVAGDEFINKLSENGQIATQYVDTDGKVAVDGTFNHNGSICAIEGITSPDGRILGKMAHSERKGRDLYKNVPFEKDQKIFESGVEYFK